MKKAFVYDLITSQKASNYPVVSQNVMRRQVSEFARMSESTEKHDGIDPLLLWSVSFKRTG
jgi:hypothetical protein